MIAYVLWYLVITAGFVSCIVTVALIWFRFPDRTSDDVVDFLLPVDFDKAADLLDPEVEAGLRKQLSPMEFRRLQRKRIHHYMAFVKRMSHNAAVLVEWANREAESRDPRQAELAGRLQQLGVEVRLYSLLTLLKLRFWLLLRLDWWNVLPAPSLDDLREAGGIRGLETYDRLKSAASFLFLELGQGDFEELLHNL
jgi:hypothetical protein